MCVCVCVCVCVQTDTLPIHCYSISGDLNKFTGAALKGELYYRLRIGTASCVTQQESGLSLKLDLSSTEP